VEGNVSERISSAAHTVGPYMSFRIPVPMDPPNKQKMLKDPSHDMSETDLSERMFSV
jgi:hypothetical protein